MADEKNLNYLVTETRDSFGKGAARKIRAVGKIPAVLYGHGSEPQHLTLPGHQVGLIIRKANQVIELEIGGKVQLALVKDVQRDPVRQIIEHLDLVVVRKGEKVQVEVSVHVVGEPSPGTVAELDTQRLLLEVLATSIPERVEVNIDGLEAGARVVAGDVILPEGATLISDAEALVVAVAVPQEQDLGETPEVDEVAEAPAAEEVAE
ncbi:MAG: 50S ribosomal protein L25/general stress protein Ctc [Lacisediminihabitans sp.]